MRVKPLTGHVLIELDDRERVTHGGIAIPDHTLSPEEHQAEARRPVKPPGLKGTVREIGPWPKLPNGKLLMPEYGIGARVVIPRHCGVEMHWEVSGRLKMVRQEDVLAVIT